MNINTKAYQWAVIGAGPAGLAAVGCLIDRAVDPQSILWVDPEFKVGDFGKHWGEVSSNTTIALFTEFLQGIKAFNYHQCPESLLLDDKYPHHFISLKEVAKPLQWISQQLQSQVNSLSTTLEQLIIEDGYWKLETPNGNRYAEKVILATGASPKHLSIPEVATLPLSVGLKPHELAKHVKAEDTIAVFGSSHSAMIIIRNLIESGVKKIINFYQSPIKYALPMDGWILYDNTGLKGATAMWTRENISQRLHPKVERVLSNESNINKILPHCTQAIYAIGFKQRTPAVDNIDPKAYDKHCGIIAPGLFGCGIGFPRQVTDPFGNKELNVGLFKFMRDIKQCLPIWENYHL